MSFALTTSKLLDLIDPKNPAYLGELGGAAGLAAKLRSSLQTGLVADDMAERTAFYGSNALPQPVSLSFLEFVWEALQDGTLNVLMVAAVVEVAIGIYKTVSLGEETALIDGAAIFGASGSLLTQSSLLCLSPRCPTTASRDSSGRSTSLALRSRSPRSSVGGCPCWSPLAPLPSATSTPYRPETLSPLTASSSRASTWKPTRGDTHVTQLADR